MHASLGIRYYELSLGRASVVWTLYYIKHVAQVATVSYLLAAQIGDHPQSHQQHSPLSATTELNVDAAEGDRVQPHHFTSSSCAICTFTRISSSFGTLEPESPEF